MRYGDFDMREFSEDNILWFHTKDNSHVLLFVTYNSLKEGYKENAQTLSILESEIKNGKKDDLWDDDITGLDLHISQVPEFLGKHFVGNVRLYGIPTRVVLRIFEQTKDGLKQIKPDLDFFSKRTDIR